MSQTAEESANRATIERYFEAIAAGPTLESIDAFHAPDVIQEELPNALLPTGARRTLADLRAAAERGRALMASQSFEAIRMFASGNTVIVESRWTGTVAKTTGPFQAGTVLRARFAQFFELRDGLIVAIRNYDCIDPW